MHKVRLPTSWGCCKQMVSPPSLATDRALSAAVCPCEPPSKARRRCVEHRLRCALHTAEFHNHRSEHVPVQYDPVKYRPCPTSTAEPPPTMLRSAGHPFPSPLSRGLELVVAQCQFNQLHFIQKLDAARPVERSLCGVCAAGCIAIRTLAIGVAQSKSILRKTNHTVCVHGFCLFCGLSFPIHI